MKRYPHKKMTITGTTVIIAAANSMFIESPVRKLLRRQSATAASVNCSSLFR